MQIILSMCVCVCVCVCVYKVHVHTSYFNSSSARVLKVLVNGVTEVGKTSLVRKFCVG